MAKKFLLLLLFAINVLSFNVTAEEVYIFTYFTGRGESGLHIAYSHDGLTWNALFDGKAILPPMIGNGRLMRDPSLTRDKEGTFHMVWTTGWWENGFGYAYSRDLVNWSEQRVIPVMEGFPAARNTWAPEIFYDQKQNLYYIIWASTITGKFPEIETTPNEVGLNHRLYYVTTRDFKTFSPTSMFYDPGFSVIDGTIVKKNSKYWLIFKNEMSVPREKNLRVTFTDKLKSGFPNEISENISGDSWAEGPSPLVIGEYVYVYFDKYREGRFGTIRSKDGITWEDVSHKVSFPAGIRHGTALKVPKCILNVIQEAYKQQSK